MPTSVEDAFADPQQPADKPASTSAPAAAPKSIGTSVEDVYGAAGTAPSSSSGGFSLPSMKDIQAGLAAANQVTNRIQRHGSRFVDTLGVPGDIARYAWRSFSRGVNQSQAALRSELGNHALGPSGSSLSTERSSLPEDIIASGKTALAAANTLLQPLYQVVSDPFKDTARAGMERLTPHVQRPFNLEEQRAYHFGGPGTPTSFFKDPWPNPDEWSTRIQQAQDVTEFAVQAFTPTGPIHGAAEAERLAMIERARSLKLTPFQAEQAARAAMATPPASAVKPKPVKVKPPSFATEDGTKYAVHPTEGKTRRAGATDDSEHTLFLKPEDAQKLQAKMVQLGTTATLQAKDNRVALRFEEGEHKGKFDADSRFFGTRTPIVGRVPVEIRAGGKEVHIGTPVKDIEETPKSSAPNAPPKPTPSSGLKDDLPINDFFTKAVRKKADKTKAFEIMQELHDGKIDEAKARVRLRALVDEANPKPPAAPTPAAAPPAAAAAGSPAGPEARKTTSPKEWADATIKHGSPNSWTEYPTKKGKVRIVTLPGMHGLHHSFAYDEAGNNIGELSYHTTQDKDPVSAVDKDWQRQGVGTALYDEAEKHGGVVDKGQNQSPDAKAFHADRAKKKAANAPAQGAAHADKLKLTDPEVSTIVGVDGHGHLNPVPEGFNARSWAGFQILHNPSRLEVVRGASKDKTLAAINKDSELAKKTRAELEAKDREEYERTKKPGETFDRWKDRVNVEAMDTEGKYETTAEKELQKARKDLADQEEAMKSLPENLAPFLRKMQEDTLAGKKRLVAELEAKVAQAPTLEEAKAQSAEAPKEAEQEAQRVLDEAEKPHAEEHNYKLRFTGGPFKRSIQIHLKVLGDLRKQMKAKYGKDWRDIDFSRAKSDPLVEQMQGVELDLEHMYLLNHEAGLIDERGLRASRWLTREHDRALKEKDALNTKRFGGFDQVTKKWTEGKDSDELREAWKIADKREGRLLTARNGLSGRTTWLEHFPGYGPMLPRGARVRVYAQSGGKEEGTIIAPKTATPNPYAAPNRYGREFSYDVRLDNGKVENYFPVGIDEVLSPHSARFSDAKVMEGHTPTPKITGRYSRAVMIDQQMGAAHGYLRWFFGQGPGAQSTTHQLLDSVLSFMSPGYLHDYLTLLRGHVDDFPVEIKQQLYDIHSGAPTEAYGQFIYNTTMNPDTALHSIQLKVRAAQDTVGAMHTLVHEMTHAVTSRFIRANPDDPLVKRLQELHGHLKVHVLKQSKTSAENLYFYGLSKARDDVHELVAEAFTDSPFMKWLGNVDPTQLTVKLGKLIGQIQATVFDAARKALGMPVGQAKILNEIMTVSERIMAKESQIRREGPGAWWTYGQPARQLKVKPGAMKWSAPHAEEAEQAFAEEHRPPRKVSKTAHLELGRDTALQDSKIPGMAGLAHGWEWMLKGIAPESLGHVAEKAGAYIASRIAEQIMRTVNYEYKSDGRLRWWQRHLDQVTPFMVEFEKGNIKPGHPLYDTALAYKNWAFNIFKQDFTQSGVIYTPRENYLTHLFKERDQVERWLQGKGKKWGDPSFMKDRMFSTYEEALKEGFTPLYKTPEEIMLARQRASDVALMQVEMLRDLERGNMAIKKKGIPKPPRGYSPWRAPNGDSYWIHDDARQILHNQFNSYTMWSDRSPIGAGFRAWMFAKNTLVPFRLALSAFHPLHVAGIDVAQTSILALKGVLSGKVSPLKAAGQMLTGELFYNTFYSNPKLGSRIIRMIRGQHVANPSQFEIESLKRMQEGGMVGVLSDTERMKGWQTYRRAVREGSVSAYWKFPGAIMHGMGMLIFDHWIPSLKVAAYNRQAALALEINPILKTDADARKIAFHKIAKSIDNRYGEMNYDTLFWNRLVRNIGVATTLSLGWNLGFMREFGGGAWDAARAATKPTSINRRLKAGELDRTLFATSYMVHALVYGGLITAFSTGKAPEGWKDLVYPIWGENEDGTPQRSTTMFYTREVGALWLHSREEGPLAGLNEYVASKGSGVLGPLSDFFAGMDKFGREIADPKADLLKNVGQRLAYTMGEFEPMSIKALQDPHQRGSAVLPFLGFGPAPRYVEESPLEGQIRLAYQNYVGHPRTGYDRVIQARILEDLRQLYVNQDPSFWDEYDAMVEKYDLDPHDASAIRRSIADRRGPFIHMFQRIGDVAGWTEQKALLDQMSPEEREQYLPYAVKRKRATYEEPE